MTSLDNLTEFLFDSNRPLSSKAAVVVFGIIAIILVDNILGFSYSFNTDKKIDQVQRLNMILKDSTVDSTTKIFVLNTRSEIIGRKNIINQILSIFQRSPKNISQNISIPKQNNRIKNNFWFIISSGGIYYLCSILMIPIMLTGNKKQSFAQRLAEGIIATIVFGLIGIFFSWSLGLIPQISSSNYGWNYLLNSFVQISSFVILYLIGDKK